MPATRQSNPGRRLGYYVFFGQGDYPEKVQPQAHWGMTEWRAFVAWMAARGGRTLWVLLNGFFLAYPSRRYPGLIDPQAANARDNFLPDLIEFAHDHGVAVHLALTADDHARAFGEAHPEAVRIDADGTRRPPQALTLEHPLTRRYVTDVLGEVLELYPKADGIVIHPTETDPDRFNPETLAAWREETGGDFRSVGKTERFAWYNRRFASCAAEWCRLARGHYPELEFTLFNCWWQDDHTDAYRELLPADARVCVWYYNWRDPRPEAWPIHRWVAALGPDRIVYMPTSCGYLYPAETAQKQERHDGTDRLISTADAIGVADVVYFAGWSAGTPSERDLDAALAFHPTTSLITDPAAKRAILPRLYADYAATRRELLSPS